MTIIILYLGLHNLLFYSELLKRIFNPPSVHWVFLGTSEIFRSNIFGNREERAHLMFNKLLKKNYWSLKYNL